MSVSGRNISQYAQALQKTARFLCAGEVAVVDADPLLDEEKMCSRGESRNMEARKVKVVEDQGPQQKQ